MEQDSTKFRPLCTEKRPIFFVYHSCLRDKMGGVKTLFRKQVTTSPHPIFHKSLQCWHSGLSIWWSNLYKLLPYSNISMLFHSHSQAFTALLCLIHPGVASLTMWNVGNHLFLVSYHGNHKLLEKTSLINKSSIYYLYLIDWSVVWCVNSYIRKREKLDACTFRK